MHQPLPLPADGRKPETNRRPERKADAVGFPFLQDAVLVWLETGRKSAIALKFARPGKLPDGVAMATSTAKSRSRAAPTARLEARIPRDLKKTLEQAAAVTGHPTVTSFVLFALQASARKVIEEHQQTKLSAEESTNFVKALLAPAAPNAALRGAFKRYREASA